MSAPGGQQWTSIGPWVWLHSPVPRPITRIAATDGRAARHRAIVSAPIAARCSGYPSNHDRLVRYRRRRIGGACHHRDAGPAVAWCAVSGLGASRQALSSHRATRVRRRRARLRCTATADVVAARGSDVDLIDVAVLPPLMSQTGWLDRDRLSLDHRHRPSTGRPGAWQAGLIRKVSANALKYDSTAKRDPSGSISDPVPIAPLTPRFAPRLVLSPGPAAPFSSQEPSARCRLNLRMLPKPARTA